VNVRGSAPGYLNTPDDAYLLRSGLVTVADAYNCRVLFIARDHVVVRRYGNGVCVHDPPRELAAVNGATPLPDGGILVSEINGSWIDDISASGRLRWAARAPVSYPSDPQLIAPNRILLADYARPGHALIMTRSGKVLWRYGPSSGPGALDHPSLAMRLAPGLVAINDDYRDRVVIVSIRTDRIVWQYGHTDMPGRRPGYLNTPDGLDLLPTAAAAARPAVRALLARRP
jgi:outer membrane protein assembly factor BamB